MIYKEKFKKHYENGELARLLVGGLLEDDEKLVVLTSVNASLCEDNAYAVAEFCEVDVTNNEILTDKTYKQVFENEDFNVAASDLYDYLLTAEGRTFVKGNLDLADFEGKSYVVSNFDGNLTCCEVENFLKVREEELDLGF